MGALFGLPSAPDAATLPRMEPTPPHRSLVTRAEILPPGAGSTTAPALTGVMLRQLVATCDISAAMPASGSALAPASRDALRAVEI